MIEKLFTLLFLTAMVTSCNNDKQEITYLALGDSYTIGECVTENERWPVQLADSLRSTGMKITNPVIIATTGWTTGELANGIVEANINTTFDIVSLMIGVNNQYRGGDIGEFRDQLRDLLGTAIEYAGGKREKVFVLSIPDWGVTPFAANRDREKTALEIDSFNLVIKEECLKENIEYHDITGISREASYDTGLVAEDGLHPSARMYSLWVHEIFSSVASQIK